jgi:16S rRNA C1402 N4-methylase RsmH
MAQGRRSVPAFVRSPSTLRQAAAALSRHSCVCTGTLHAFDMDDVAVAVGKQLEKEDPRFKMHKGMFASMFSTMKGLGVKVDGVLLDIGISSPQLDGDRGFRPEMEGPLDLRFDLNSGKSSPRQAAECSPPQAARG